MPENRVLEIKDKDGKWSTAPLNVPLSQSVLISDVALPVLIPKGSTERSAWAESALRLTGPETTGHYKLGLDMMTFSLAISKSKLQGFLADTQATQGIECSGIPEKNKIAPFKAPEGAWQPMFSDVDLIANQEVRMCMNFTNDNPEPYQKDQVTDFYYKFNAKPLN